jgi:hypothetical protein
MYQEIQAVAVFANLSRGSGMEFASRVDIYEGEFAIRQSSAAFNGEQFAEEPRSKPFLKSHVIERLQLSSQRHNAKRRDRL